MHAGLALMINSGAPAVELRSRHVFDASNEQSIRRSLFNAGRSPTGFLTTSLSSSSWIAMRHRNQSWRYPPSAAKQDGVQLVWCSKTFRGGRCSAQEQQQTRANNVAIGRKVRTSAAITGGELKHWIKYVAPDGLMVEEFQSKPGGKTSRNRRSFGRTRLRMAKEASNFQSNLTNLRLFKRGKKSKEITFYAKRFMWVEPQGKKSPQTKCCQHTQLAIL